MAPHLQLEAINCPVITRQEVLFSTARHVGHPTQTLCHASLWAFSLHQVTNMTPHPHLTLPTFFQLPSPQTLRRAPIRAAEVSVFRFPTSTSTFVELSLVVVV